MQQEQQKTENAVLSVVIINGDIKSLSQAQKLNCCRRFFNALGMKATDLQHAVAPEVDAWGYKQVVGPAFPLSLFADNKGLEKLMKTCTDEDEFLSLYNDNKERIEKNPELRLSFAEKQQLLNEKGKI